MGRSPRSSPNFFVQARARYPGFKCRYRIFQAGAVISPLRVNGKKQALQEMSERAALSQAYRRGRFSMRFSSASGSARPASAMASPSRMASSPVPAHLRRVRPPGAPYRFRGAGRPPVDLIFLLIAPEAPGADHLKALAMSARLLRNSAVAAQLRAARDPTALYALLTLAPTSNAA